MKLMYAPDCGSTGAPEMSWFHQLLDGKSARPPKSSKSLTVLRAGGCGAGAGAGAGDGAGVVVVVGGSDSVGGVGVSLGVLAVDDGARGVKPGSLPQPEISAQTTRDSAAAERMRPLPGRDNRTN
jgi:hypothetical protein